MLLCSLSHLNPSTHTFNRLHSNQPPHHWSCCLPSPSNKRNSPWEINHKQSSIWTSYIEPKMTGAMCKMKPFLLSWNRWCCVCREIICSMFGCNVSVSCQCMASPGYFPQSQSVSCAQHHVMMIVMYTGVQYARDTGSYLGCHLEMGCLSDFRPSPNE